MAHRCRLFINTKLLAQHLNATTPSSTVYRAIPITPAPYFIWRYRSIMRNIININNTVAVRCYSSGPTSAGNGAETQTARKNEYTDNSSENGIEDALVDEGPNVERLRSDIDLKDKEIIELKDKYLRSVADYRNLQQRTKREVQAARDYAIQRFATDLLESLDNFDRALGQVSPEKITKTSSVAQTPSSSSLSSPLNSEISPTGTSDGSHKDLLDLHSGLQMTHRVLMQTLRRHGLAPFDPTAEAEQFDPNKHEAMFQAPQTDKEDGSVFHTQQKGYMLNGRVLRAAKVGVVKNS